MGNIIKNVKAPRPFKWALLLGLALLGGCYNPSADLAPAVQSATQNPPAQTYSSPTTFLNTGGNFGLANVFQVWWVNAGTYDVIVNPNFDDNQFASDGIGGMSFYVQAYGHGGWAGMAFVNPNWNKTPNYTDYSSGNFTQCTLIARAYPYCQVTFNALAPAAYNDVGGKDIDLVNQWQPVTMTLDSNLTQVYMDFYIALGDTVQLPYYLYVYDIVLK
jgi:hypothetical protein